MVNCTFELNGQKMSSLVCGSTSFRAFSGAEGHINKRTSACLKNAGPIPPEIYYIFDRQSGGLLGPLRDLFNGRDEWFALYTIDSRIDDETLCNNIKRGQFRLHPKGVSGRSEGCIVIEKPSDFMYLKTILRNQKQIEIPNVDLKAYGKLVVT
jgi:hypothetical protein